MWPTLFGAQPKCVTRRFVFDASALVALKAKVQHSTRVMVVMGLIWKTAMAASNTVSGFRKPSIFTFSMNLRPRHMHHNCLHVPWGTLYGTLNALYITLVVLVFCNGGLYVVDFGWGRPVWSRTSSFDTGLPIVTKYNTLVMAPGH